MQNDSWLEAASGEDGARRCSGRHRRGASALGVTAAVTLALAQAASMQAAAAEPAGASIKVEVPAQSLADSLQAIARQTNINILVDPSLVSGREAPALDQPMPLEQALSKLLEGTGLTSKFVDERTIVVAAAPSAARAADTGTLRLAQAQVPPASSEQQSADGRDVEPASTAAPAEAEKPLLEEIVVTGSHIRGAEIAAPTMSFTREELDQAGFSTVEDFFQTLPQNIGEISPAGAAATGVSRLAASNTQRAHGISLRGLGPESTLVLLNGKRRPGNINGQVVDISAIPMSVIERVEVVTGGRSATYGTDAVAGVVNLTTRRSFDGAESQVYYGAADEGGERFQASQIFGIERERGGFVVAYDYTRDRGLDLVADTDVARPPSPLGITLEQLSIIPPRRRHSGYFSGRYALSDAVEVYGDVLYTNSRNQASLRMTAPILPAPAFQNTDTESEQYSGVLGARFDLGSSWSLDVSGLHGAVDNHELFFSQEGMSGTDTRALLSSISAVADGELFVLGGRSIKAAVGAELREESYKDIPFDPDSTRYGGNRTVKSLFGELAVPLVENGAWSGLRELELSLAARYDDYDDFGDTLNPQLGVIWRPSEHLQLRGAYSTAYRVPALFYLSFATASDQAYLYDLPDPASPGGASPTLVLSGANPAMGPEEAKTWSIGLDYAPAFAPWAELSMSYFRIEYDNRIDQPAMNYTTALATPELYTGLIDRSPDDDQLAAILARSRFENFTGVAFDPETQSLLDVLPNLVVFDNRRTNISQESLRGLDFRLSSRFDSAIGRLTFGLNGTYYFESERRTTPTSPLLDQLNRPGKPVDLQLRFNAGWARNGCSAFVFVNHADDYRDTEVSPSLPIDSHTTVDLTLRYDTSGRLGGGLADGLAVALHVTNLFDRDPPEFLNDLRGIGYDPANASAVGRVTSLRLTKSW